MIRLLLGQLRPSARPASPSCDNDSTCQTSLAPLGSSCSKIYRQHLHRIKHHEEITPYIVAGFDTAIDNHRYVLSHAPAFHTPVAANIDHKVISCTLALFLSGYAAQQRTLKELRSAIRPRHRPTKPYLPEQFKPKVVELEDGSQVILESDAEREKKQHRETIVEVHQSKAVQQPIMSASQGVSANKLQIIQQLQADVAAKSWAVENPDPLSKNHVPMSKAERRKAIKEELKRLGQSEEPVLWQRRMW